MLKGDAIRLASAKKWIRFRWMAIVWFHKWPFLFSLIYPMRNSPHGSLMPIKCVVLNGFKIPATSWRIISANFLLMQNNCTHQHFQVIRLKCALFSGNQRWFMSKHNSATTEHTHVLCHLTCKMIDKCEKTSYIIGSTQSNRFIANQLNKLFIQHILEAICFLVASHWQCQ